MNIKEYKNKVASLGCIVEHCGQPANRHHPRFTLGMAQRSSDWLVIPLCHYHHQGGNFGHAIHNGKAIFEKTYGSEAELLARTIKAIMGGI